jgi:uncharacterized DUF497 family protein
MQAFEWDETKKDLNLEKHGIDFLDAIEVFHDHNRIELETIRHGEVRYQTIACVNNVVLLIVYTIRNKVKRIISARRASKNERKAYFDAQ